MTLVDFELDAGGEAAAVTTANSGAQQVTGGTITYRAAAAVGGSAFGVRHVNGASAASITRYNASATNNQMSYRHHSTGPYGGTRPLAAFVGICGWRYTGGNFALLRWQTDESCTFNDGSGALIGTILPAGSDPTIMYGWTLVVNNSTGAYVLKCYLPNGSLVNTLSGTRTWSQTGVQQAIQVGVLTTPTTSYTVDIDAVSMNDGSTTELAPRVSSSPATATAVAATASASMNVPVVEGETVLSGGGSASAASAMLAPAVTGVRSQTVAAVVATASALAPAPLASAALNPTVIAVVAAASALAPAPTPTATRVPTVVSPATSASGLALAPSITAAAMVQPTASSANALVPAPVVTATRNAAVVATAALGSALGLAPGVIAGGSAVVLPPAATTTALAPAPAVSATRSAIVVAGPPPSATLAALSPLVTGTSSATIAVVAAQATAQAFAALIGGPPLDPRRLQMYIDNQPVMVLLVETTGGPAIELDAICVE